MASNPPNVPSRSGSIVNGPPSAGIHPPGSSVPPPTPGGVAPQTNLNQIVRSPVHVYRSPDQTPRPSYSKMIESEKARLHDRKMMAQRQREKEELNIVWFCRGNVPRI
jgi:hypothetical protein